MIIEFLLLLWISRRVRHRLDFKDLQDQWWNKTSTKIEEQTPFMDFYGK